VKVTVEDDEMTIDLTDVAKQVKGFYNSGYAAGMACCQVAFKCLTTPHEKPINDGSFRPLTIILPPGRVVSALRPAPMRWWMTFPMTIVDTIFKALADAVPDRVTAGHHADLLSAAINGSMPADGRIWLVSGGLVGGGWGAKRGLDGQSATICINDGDTHNSPVEQLEAKYPMLVDRYSLREDSGGAGTWQGGLGTEKAVRAISEFNFNAQVERVHCRPWGLFGGHPGAGNQVSIQIDDQPELKFPSGKVLGRLLKSGDTYILRSGGGGGYGSPLERPIEKVVFDYQEGYVSRERVENCYGVVFFADGQVDFQASQLQRQQMKQVEVPYDDLPQENEEKLSAADEKLFTQGKGFFWRKCC
jgi:N-methylhydantoinase B